MKPIIVKPGSRLEDFTMADLSDTFNFLRDEYLSAVDYLEGLGIFVQETDDSGQVQTKSLVEMIEIALNKGD